MYSRNLQGVEALRRWAYAARDETISLCSRIELRGSLLYCGWLEPAAEGGKANYATLQSYTPAVYSTPSR